MDYLEALGVAD